MIPPRSLLWLRLSAVSHEARGIVSRLVLPAQLTASPLVAAFPDAAAVPRDVAEIAALLTGAQRIDPDAGVPEFARSARRRLHSALAHPSPVRQVARAMDVAPDTITRAFRAAYSLSPKAYVQAARVSDGVLSLLAGASVLRAAFEACFNDLSRFYRAFRRLTGNTPGEYRALHDRKPPRHAPRGEPL